MGVCVQINRFCQIVSLPMLYSRSISLIGNCWCYVTVTTVLFQVVTGYNFSAKSWTEQQSILRLHACVWEREGWKLTFCSLVLRESERVALSFFVACFILSLRILGEFLKKIRNVMFKWWMYLDYTISFKVLTYYETASYFIPIQYKSS